MASIILDIFNLSGSRLRWKLAGTEPMTLEIKSKELISINLIIAPEDGASFLYEIKHCSVLFCNFVYRYLEEKSGKKDE